MGRYVASGVSKDLLRFEHTLLDANSNTVFDIDLGIKSSVGSSTYSEAYQLKSNTAALSKNTVQNAAPQIANAPANKKILEYKLIPSDNLSGIQSNTKLIEQLKVRLDGIRFETPAGIPIDEIRLRFADGSKVKVVFQNNSLQFINF